MASVSSTFALDTGLRLGDRFFDVRWASKPGTPPQQRWFTSEQDLPDGSTHLWGYGEVDVDGRLVIHYDHPELVNDERPDLSLWFVLVDMRHFNPPHLVLLSYRNDAMPRGTVVGAKEASEMFDDEFLSSWAGMINWRYGDPELQQITTAPNWRRKRVALTMTICCDIVNGCYGFSPGKVLHGGSITTSDGEKLRGAFSGARERVEKRIGSVSTLDQPASTE